MADDKTGFFSGIFNPDRAVPVDKTVSNIDSVIKKLGKIDSDGAAEHVEALKKHSEILADHKLKLENAINNNGDVNAAKSALREVNKEAAGGIKAGRSHIRGVNSYLRGQMVGRIATSKPALIIGGLVAAAGALSWISSKRDSQVKESQSALRDMQTQAMKADIMAMQQPMVGANTMMGLQPVAGDHANRVLAARNGGMGVDTSNPAMSAGNFDVARS